MKALNHKSRITRAISVLIASALFFTSCGAPAATQVAKPEELAPTVASPAVIEPPTQTPVEILESTVTIPPVLAAALPYPEALEVITEKDIPYTKPLQPGVIEQKLDIYYPIGKGPWPVVMIVPPIGNYRNTLTAMALGKKLAGQGMVVLALDAGTEESTYTLTVAAEDNGAAIREVLEEISCGIRFAQSKSIDYGGNPDNLIVFGYGIGSLYGLNAVLQGEQLSLSWEDFAAKRGGPQAQSHCLAEGNVENVDAFVTYGGDFNLASLKQIDPEVAAMVDPTEQTGESRGLKVALIQNRQRIKYEPLEFTIQLKDALNVAGIQAELFIVDAPSLSISSRGPELDWITNAILQYAEQ